jgi:hypothetical protein
MHIKEPIQPGAGHEGIWHETCGAETGGVCRVTHHKVLNDLRRLSADAALCGSAARLHHPGQSPIEPGNVQAQRATLLPIGSERC